LPKRKFSANQTLRCFKQQETGLQPVQKHALNICSFGAKQPDGNSQITDHLFVQAGLLWIT
jgi:hypothetical protein